MTGTYSQSLVVFSLLVAILASYTALDMAGRLASTRGRVARWWLAGGAGAMGLGIWSMHFIGMLAFHLPIPVGYDLAITLYSLAVSSVPRRMRCGWSRARNCPGRGCAPARC